MPVANKIEKAYAASKNIYDDTLTQSKWWARLYINFFLERCKGFGNCPKGAGFYSGRL